MPGWHPEDLRAVATVRREARVSLATALQRGTVLLDLPVADARGGGVRADRAADRLRGPCRQSHRYPLPRSCGRSAGAPRPARESRLFNQVPAHGTRPADALWVAFRTTYAATLLEVQRDGVTRDEVAEYAVPVSAGAAGRKPRPAHLEGRGRRLATKLVVVFATESGGLPGCLTRAERWGGFDWLRGRLELHGFTRDLAWRLCVTFHRARLPRAQPNRPYLDRRGVELAQRLLGRTGVRAHSVRDWEAALMLEVDSRLATGAHPAKLDAEIVTAVCARLARDTKGAEDRARLSLLRRRG